MQFHPIGSNLVARFETTNEQTALTFDLSMGVANRFFEAAKFVLLLFVARCAILLHNKTLRSQLELEPTTRNNPKGRVGESFRTNSPKVGWKRFFQVAISSRKSDAAAAAAASTTVMATATTATVGNHFSARL